MNQTTNELKAEFGKTLATMQTLRDEIRVKLHLASMDAKSEWNKIEPELYLLEQDASKVTRTLQKSAQDLVARLQKLSASL